MADRSSIEWTDATWNPVTGCTPVSAGCANCYAKRIAERFSRLHCGEEDIDRETNIGNPVPFSTIRFHPDRLDQPLRWKRPRRIFVCSMGDLFHEDVPWKWINDVAGTMCLAKQHTFMVLTKRPDRMLEFIRRWKNGDATEGDGVFGSLLFGDNDPTAYKAPLPNLWLGVTAENQEMADQRIPILLQTPAAKRFVSIEPMLGPVDLGRIKIANGVVECAGGRLPPIDWVICGGETGAGARFMHPHWVENLRDQCTESGVPFFFKGWGTQAMKKSDPDYMKLDGREWKEFPEVSR